MRTSKYIGLFIMCLASLTASSQSELEVYGAGRFLLQNGSVSGAAYEGGVFEADTLAPDTVTPGREIAGQALFDLGFKFSPNKQTEIKVLTRVTSDLDGFWGQGIGFGFRELYVRGLIRNIVRYRVGDLDLKMTPFTLYNDDADLGQHRLSPLHVYEDIVQYEQFYRDNRWRQQGIQTDFKLILPGKGNSLGIDAFLAKNRQTDFFFTPDRLLGGGTATYGRRGLGEFSYNYINLFEIAQTAQFSESMSSTAVHTLGAKVQPIPDNKLVIYGEAGLSNTTYEEMDNAPADTSDYFFQLGVRSVSREDLKFFGEFIYVAQGFRSPGAQSRRINSMAQPVNFSFQGNAELQRTFTAFDLLVDPTLYNTQISAGLQSFLPAYNNVDPYGTATPNRQGLRGGINYMPDSSAIEWIGADVKLLTEVQGEGIANYRSFLDLGVNARVALNELYAGEKRFLVELAGNYQSTQRDELEADIESLQGIGEVNLTGTRIQGSLSYEIADDLYFEVGMYRVQAEGQEYLAQRNAFSEIEDYAQLDIDLVDQTVFGGFKYRFNENTNLLIQGRRTDLQPDDTGRNDYRLDQINVLFNIFF